jgi:GT2 family glycosyltransferase
MDRVNSLQKIGIVTVTFNSEDVIDGFLKSVLKQRYQNFNLYIVDNDSKDNTLSKVKSILEDERVKILENRENLGVAAGNNQGIKEALSDHCDLILLVNNDVEFDSEVFNILVESLDKESSDIVVPKIMYYDNPQKIWFAGGKFLDKITFFSDHIGTDQEDSDIYNHIKKIDYAPTCCMLLKKTVLDKVGVMDEKYFVYFDDVDFCLRVKKQNVIMSYIPTAKIYHKVGSLTGGEVSDFTLYYGSRNRVYFLKKHAHKIIWMFWLIQKQLRFLFAFLVLGKYRANQYLICQRGFFDGVRM